MWKFGDIKERKTHRNSTEWVRKQTQESSVQKLCSTIAGALKKMQRIIHEDHKKNETMLVSALQIKTVLWKCKKFAEEKS